MPLPSVSRRKHYRPVPGEPSEPTSTIVLTSPRNFYVDVRVYNIPQTQTPPARNTFDGHLQWAFAGEKDSYYSGGKNISTWGHWIDSLSDDPVQLDTGEMIELEGGDVLEKGEVVDEETGEVRRYEELWGEVELDTVEGGEGRTCVVARTDEEGVDWRGMMIRIGGFCQGILKGRDGLAVERWEWVRGEGGGKWERTVRFGEGELPCGEIVDGGEFEEGVKMDCGGIRWVVVEVATW
ncbi:MAG: hypothetical protein Q9166_007650 [cf. Caloplaca sp. 2 TL-2023]